MNPEFKEFVQKVTELPLRRFIYPVLGMGTALLAACEARSGSYISQYPTPSPIPTSTERVPTATPTILNSDPLRVTCTNDPAYGRLNLGPHAILSVNARNLNSIPSDLDGGTWLFVGKEEAGFRVVGYSSDPNSFSANMDGFINSTRGQDVLPDGSVAPITFNKGDTIYVMARRGQYEEGLPTITEELALYAKAIDCETATSAEKPLVIRPDGTVWVGQTQIYPS